MTCLFNPLIKSKEANSNKLKLKHTQRTKTMKVVQALVILGVAASSNAANLRGAYLADSNRDDQSFLDWTGTDDDGFLDWTGTVERQTNPDTMVMPGTPSLKSAPFFGETAPAPGVLKRQPVAAPTAFYAEGIARQPEGQGRIIARQPEAAKRRDVKPRLDDEPPLTHIEQEDPEAPSAPTLAYAADE